MVTVRDKIRLPLPVQSGKIAFTNSAPYITRHAACLHTAFKAVTIPSIRRAPVVLHGAHGYPIWGRYNILVHHGLGDKNYCWNPRFMQQGQFLAARSIANLVSGKLGLPTPYLQPPPTPKLRKSKYQQINSYGPRTTDIMEELISDVYLSPYGHLALNEYGSFKSQSDGPLLWMPTWDNSATLGGVNESSIAHFTDPILKALGEQKLVVKPHPLLLKHQQFPAAMARIKEDPRVTLLTDYHDPYALLANCKGLLTDTSSLSFESYAMGLPVAVLSNPGVSHQGLHGELATRTPVFETTELEALADWVAYPKSTFDQAWARDLLYQPSPKLNEMFIKEIQARLNHD